MKEVVQPVNKTMPKNYVIFRARPKLNYQALLVSQKQFLTK
jgi:hypothetical protein